MSVLTSRLCFVVASITAAVVTGCTSVRDSQRVCAFKDTWAELGEENWIIDGKTWPIAGTYFRMTITSSEPEEYSIECWWRQEQRLKRQKKSEVRRKALMLASHACRNKLYRRNVYTEEEARLLAEESAADFAVTNRTGATNAKALLKPTFPPKNVQVWFHDQPDKTKVANSRWFQFEPAEIEEALQR